MDKWRMELIRLMIRVGVCFALVVALGSASRGWALRQQQSAPQASQSPLSGSTVLDAQEVAADAPKAPQGSWLLRLLLGYEPSDPESVLGYAVPGLRQTIAQKSSSAMATADEELPAVEDDEPADHPLIIPPIVEFNADLTPRVLIYHTHTNEAYTPTPTTKYTGSEGWRSKDPAYSVVAVGEIMADYLNTMAGIGTLHDRTNYEDPKLSTAYARSREGVNATLARYGGDLDFIVDVHRDAYNSRSWEPMTVTIDGEKVARIMIIVGTGEDTGGEDPDWEKNAALAQQLIDELNRIHPNLCMKLNVKTGRYNQHLSTHAILAEVGNNLNTLDEACRAGKYLAQAMAKVLG